MQVQVKYRLTVEINRGIRIFCGDDENKLLDKALYLARMTSRKNCYISEFNECSIFGRIVKYGTVRTFQSRCIADVWIELITQV